MTSVERIVLAATVLIVAALAGVLWAQGNLVPALDDRPTAPSHEVTP